MLSNMKNDRLVLSPPTISDSYSLVYKGEDGSQTVNVSLLRTGIAWASDKNVKFGNPSCKYKERMRYLYAVLEINV